MRRTVGNITNKLIITILHKKNLSRLLFVNLSTLKRQQLSGATKHTPYCLPLTPSELATCSYDIWHPYWQNVIQSYPSELGTTFKSFTRTLYITRSKKNEKVDIFWFPSPPPYSTKTIYRHHQIHQRSTHNRDYIYECYKIIL